jgi:hypothetical protein|tara:strand:+ start:962 stop:2032 length:1071 start_codon:yes stop_codon:yes gene_type:complete
MSAYPPPKENLPIYNPTDFEYENFPLTIQDAKDYFLEYPTAQGAETLASIVVNGASTFNDVATINDSLDIIQPTSALNALNIENDNAGVSITATSKTNKGTSGALTINGSSTANKENPIVEDGDSVVSSSIQGANDTGGLTLTQKSTTGSGIRIANNKVNVFPGIVFPDGTEQTTAFTGGGNSVSTTSNIPTYDAGTNTTTYNFPSYPTGYDTFNWSFSLPFTAQTTQQKTLLGSSPPLVVGEITIQPGSFIHMVGIGVRQPYQATSSNMITYCAGFQQNYSITASGNAVILTPTSIVGTILSRSPQFFSDELQENPGTCPPTAFFNPIGGYVSLEVDGNYSNNGVATIKWTDTGS